MSLIARIAKRIGNKSTFLIPTLLAGGLGLAAFSQPAFAQGTDRIDAAQRHSFLVVLDEQAVGLTGKGMADRQRTHALTSRLTSDLAAHSGVRPSAVLGQLGMFVVEATRGEAKRLAGLPGVKLVEEDTLAMPSALPSCFAPTSFPLANSYNPTSPQAIQCWDPQLNCSDSWGLDRIDQHTGSQAAHTLDSLFHFTARGNGVHIYVVDTGLVATHSEFGLPGGGTRVGNGTNVAVTGQCRPNSNTCGDRPAWDTYDGSGHGTLVASIAAGLRFGVAKSATVHPVRISNDNGASWTSWAASGLDWVAANASLPAVVNLSYNFPISPFGDTAALDMAASRLINNYGIAIVNSAGNSNSHAGSFSPTALPEVIVVAGLDWNNYTYGAGAPFSCSTPGCGTNYGTPVDFFAPAVDILGAMGSSGQSYACIGTGTSFAAPFATGVAAQYLQSNPLATPAAVQTALINKTTPSVVLGTLNGSPNRLLFTDF